MIEHHNTTKSLISIITIVRNGVNEIEETIKSVLSQKNVNLEYIIIDGVSTDGTLDVIENYKENISIFISEADNGIYDAINKGVKLASGELIGLIHCGDSYENDVLSLCYKKYMISKSDIIYGNINILDKTDDLVFNRSEQADHRFLKKRMSIFHPATFISKSCYSKNGLYNIKYKVAADYDLLLRNLKREVKFEYISLPIATFRSGGVSGKTMKYLGELFDIWKTNLGFSRAMRNTFLRLINFLYYFTRKKIVVFIIGNKNYNKLKKNKYQLND